jgi:hypothetical protein
MNLSKIINNNYTNIIGEKTMRQFQVTIFLLGVGSFILSAFELGPGSGDYLLNAGFATMLIDLVFIQLWPSVKEP